MSAFIWTIVIFMVIEIIDKALMLHKCAFVGNPTHMLIDMVIAIVIFGWGAWLLGGSK